MVGSGGERMNMTLEKKLEEDLRMFIKNDATFQALAQKVAKEEGVGELTNDEMNVVRKIVLRSLEKIAKGV